MYRFCNIGDDNGVRLTEKAKYNIKSTLLVLFLLGIMLLYYCLITGYHKEKKYSKWYKNWSDIGTIYVDNESKKSP